MNLYSGQPWSELDIEDLKASIERGDSIEEIADFLCRDVEEVSAKLAELEQATR